MTGVNSNGESGKILKIQSPLLKSVNQNERRTLNYLLCLWNLVLK